MLNEKIITVDLQMEIVKQFQSNWKGFYHIQERSKANGGIKKHQGGGDAKLRRLRQSKGPWTTKNTSASIFPTLDRAYGIGK